MNTFTHALTYGMGKTRDLHSLNDFIFLNPQFYRLIKLAIL